MFAFCLTSRDNSLYIRHLHLQIIKMRSKQYAHEVHVLRKRVNHLREGRQAFTGERVNLFRTGRRSDTATQRHKVFRCVGWVKELYL